MTIREALYEYFGTPESNDFNEEEFKGRYGGLINAIGLRHKGVIASASTIHVTICNYFKRDFDRWEFLYELTNWCAQYTNTQNKKITIGSGSIHKGIITINKVKYFCVPSAVMSLKVAL